MRQHVSDRVGDALVAGASVDDAARHVGVTRRTVQRWLKAGRCPGAEPGLRRLATRVDAARRRQDLSSSGPIHSLAELHCIIDRAARAGNVAAMRLVFDRLCRAARAA